MRSKQVQNQLSIIVASWNTKNLLKKCLESIDHPAEIIVVDNGSTDGSVEYLKSRGQEIKTIFNKKNFGFAKANNQGIEIATGKYVLLLNSDTVVQPKALGKLVEFLDQRPDVVAVSPLLLNPNGTPQLNYYMKFPNIWQILLYHNIVLRPLVMKTPVKNLIVSRLPEVDQLPGAALMTRQEVFQKTKGLDLDYSFLFEDVDWCYRAKQLGRLMVVPEAKITHVGGASWKKRLNQNRFGFYRHYFASFLLFVEKHYPEKLPGFKRALKITFLLNAATFFLIFPGVGLPLQVGWDKGVVQLKLFRCVNAINRNRSNF